MKDDKCYSDSKHGVSSSHMSHIERGPNGTKFLVMSALREDSDSGVSKMRNLQSSLSRSNSETQRKRDEGGSALGPPIIV
jgi:hypothetical protein